jgi:hypothetical protein
MDEAEILRRLEAAEHTAAGAAIKARQALGAAVAAMALLPFAIAGELPTRAEIDAMLARVEDPEALAAAQVWIEPALASIERYTSRQ